MPSTWCARLCITKFLLCFGPSCASLALYLWDPHWPPFSAWKMLSMYFSTSGLLQMVVYLLEVSPLALYLGNSYSSFRLCLNNHSWRSLLRCSPDSVLLLHAVRDPVVFLIAFFAPFNNRFYLYSIYSTVQ